MRKTSRRTERGDRGGRERGEKNVGDMKICEGAREERREQSRTCGKKKMQQRLVSPCVALTTRMKLGCHMMLKMVIISRSHTRSTALARVQTLKTTPTPPHLSLLLLLAFGIFAVKPPCSAFVFKLFHPPPHPQTVVVLSTYFCAPPPYPASNKALNKIPPHFLQLEMCESLRECGGV